MPRGAETKAIAEAVALVIVSAWYGYDWNGRMDSVWTKVSASGVGLGVSSPAYVAAESRPAEADIVYSYSKRGAVSSMSYPPVSTEITYHYNARAFLDDLLAQKSGSLAFRQLLEYDILGNITRQTSQQSGQPQQVQDYVYNEVLGFLTDWIPSGQSSVSYEYDDIGNRESSGTLSALGTYEYNSVVHPNQLTKRRDYVLQNGNWTQTGYTEYVYNANGAMTVRTDVFGVQTVSSETFGYDNIQGVVKQYVRTQGTSVDDWRYRYTASGEREQKRLYSTTQQPAKEWSYYLLDGVKRQLAVYAGVETQQTSCGSTTEPRVYLSASEYLFYGQGSVHNITVRPISPVSTRKEYKVQDMLGSTRVVIEPDGMGGGAITGQYDYEPFGKVSWQSGPSKRLSFIDKEKDKESSLGDFGVRKYDDGIGRFTSIDPLWEKYRSLSPYNYCGNNPMMFVDPTGTEWYDLDGQGNWTYKKDTEKMTVLRKDEEGNDVMVEVAGIKQLLSFDGKQLTWHKADGSMMSWKAVSGKVGKDEKTDPSKQMEKSGPIPEGDYYVDSEETQRWDDQTTVTQMKSMVGRGAWPGGTNSWGEIRVPINQKTDFRGERTGNYFIHGGTSPGSRGCIDLTSQNNSFFKAFTSSSVVLPLFVRY